MAQSHIKEKFPSAKSLPDISGANNSKVEKAPNTTSQSDQNEFKPNAKNASNECFVPAIKPSAFVTENMFNPDYATLYAQVVADAKTLTKGQLQSRYQAEYNSLRSRKEKAKQRHIKFFDGLKDIRDWLIHLGPRPAKGWTVDRIKGTKGYQPGNLRWATKIQQTHNRKVTKWHQLPNGELLTTQQFADRLGVPYQTLYKRLRTGWSVDRLLQNEMPSSLASWRFPPELAQHCELLYRQRKYFPQHRIDWFIEYFNDVLYNKLNVKWNTLGNAVSNLIEMKEQARADRKKILLRQKELEDQKLKELLIILDPPLDSAFTPCPKSMTDDEYERFLEKYSQLL